MAEPGPAEAAVAALVTSAEEAKQATPDQVCQTLSPWPGVAVVMMMIFAASSPLQTVAAGSLRARVTAGDCNGIESFGSQARRRQ